MNKLILIGNGFDLAHGLKTKYTDFMVWYLNKAFDKFKENKLFKDDLLEIGFDYSQNQFGMASQEYLLEPIEQFRIIQNFFEVKQKYRFVNHNFKHHFFEGLISNRQEHNWVDIEAKYYDALIHIYKLTESTNYSGDLQRLEIEVKKLNDCFEFIKKELVEYLTEIDGKLKQGHNDIDSHISSLLQATKHENDRSMGSSVSPFSSVYILNFNYTSSIEKYIDKAHYKDICEINYIHGKLTDPNNPIIFGYGDEIDYYEKIEKLNSNEFLKKFKSFGYFKSNNYQDFLKFVNTDAPYEVHIMGHSCGLSDRILLNSIFERRNCKSIKIYYHQESETENDFVEKTYEISRHFSIKGKEKMRETIVPFPNSVPLTKFNKTYN